MDKSASGNNFQLFWGIALILAGLGVFYRVPQVMPEIGKISQFSGSASWVIRICFYVMGIILLGGGIRKVRQYLRQKQSDHSRTQQSQSQE